MGKDKARDAKFIFKQLVNNAMNKLSACFVILCIFLLSSSAFAMLEFQQRDCGALCDLEGLVDETGGGRTTTEPAGSRFSFPQIDFNLVIIAIVIILVVSVLYFLLRFRLPPEQSKLWRASQVEKIMQEIRKVIKL